jgi:hypothetical protein
LSEKQTFAQMADEFLCRTPRVQLDPAGVQLARISAVVDFLSETDAAMWRAHVVSLHAPHWPWHSRKALQ